MSKAFCITAIPQQFKNLNSYNYWRQIGPNIYGAILIVLIDYWYSKNQKEKIDEMIKKIAILTKKYSQQFADILFECQKCQNQLQSKQQFYEMLSEKDKMNNIAQSYFNDYINSVNNYEVKEESLIAFVYTQFAVKIQIMKSQQEQINQDQQIFIYKQEANYYLIIQDNKQLQNLCIFCYKINDNQNIQNLTCNHQICKICIQKLTQSNQTEIRCNNKKCPGVMKIKQHLELENQNQLICSQCQNRKQNCQIIKTIDCNHQFCLECVRRSLSVLPNTSYSQCFKCTKGHFDLDELNKFKQVGNKQEQNDNQNKIKENNNYKQQQQQQQQQQIILNEYETPQLQSLCYYCMKKYDKFQMYFPQCNHAYCKNCLDKEINKGTFKFICYQSNCNNQIDLSEAQMHYYNLIKQQTFDKCSNCKIECKISESFQNTCGHVLCLNCVKKIYKLNQLPSCKSCNKSISEKYLDQFYFNNSGIIHNDVEFPNDNIPQHIEQQQYDNLFCTFCFTPFNEYNIQQDLECKKHFVGTCCIIYQVDCPQCQLQTLKIFKRGLKLKTYKNENTNFQNILEKEYANKKNY